MLRVTPRGLHSLDISIGALAECWNLLFGTGGLWVFSARQHRAQSRRLGARGSKEQIAAATQSQFHATPAADIHEDPAPPATLINSEVESPAVRMAARCLEPLDFLGAEPIEDSLAHAQVSAEPFGPHFRSHFRPLPVPLCARERENCPETL